VGRPIPDWSVDAAVSQKCLNLHVINENIKIFHGVIQV
jgi:hypothetical protein